MLAIVFAFLVTCGFAIGNVLVRVGTQKVPAPTAAGPALILNWNDIGSHLCFDAGYKLNTGSRLSKAVGVDKF